MARPPEKNPSQSRIGLWIEQVTVALTSNLTVSENLAQCWVDVEIRYGVPIPLIALPELRGRTPYGVTVEKATVKTGALFGAPGIEWETVNVKGAPGLKILQGHGLTPDTTVKFRLLVKAQ